MEIGLAGLAALAVTTLMGAALQAAFGFGFAILAAPIFLATIGTGAAIQLLVVLHVVLVSLVVPGTWQAAPKPLLGWLAAGALAGFPLGLMLFLAADARALQLSVGVATVIFSLLLAYRELGSPATSARDPERPDAFRAGTALLVGALSGLLTSVLVMPGPPAMIYTRTLDLAKQASRALSHSFFGFCYVMATVLHAFFAGMHGSVWLVAAVLAPCVLVGSMAGTRAAHFLSEERFRRAVLALLILSGLFAVVAALR
jgi:hypothetical protein